MPCGGAGDIGLLYNAVLQSKAKRVIETGVAYGWSTLAILAAMEANGRGQLVSVDMPYPKMRNENFVGIVSFGSFIFILGIIISGICGIVALTSDDGKLRENKTLVFRILLFFVLFYLFLLFFTIFDYSSLIFNINVLDWLFIDSIIFIVITGGIGTIAILFSRID